MTTLAIDIGGTKLVAALIGTGRRIRDHRELPTLASQTPEALRDTLSALVSPLQAHVRWVVIASTGIVRDDNLLALNPHDLDGLLHSPLVKTLEQLTNLPTIAINDAQAAAWAEYQALEGDVTEMVFITVSTGVDGGVVNGGKPLTDSGGLAGHIGYMLAGPHGPIYGCRRTSCVEVIISSRSIAAAVQGELAGADAGTVFARTGQGGEQTRQLIHRSARMLVRLIADIKATTNCQHVMVGGNADLAEGYLVLMGMHLAQEPAVFHADLLATHYHHDAGLLGAALLAQGEKL